MNRLAFTLAFAAAALLVLGSTALSANTAHVVSPTDGDYRRIQDAVDAADSSDIIIVTEGTYRENILIEHPVSILGEEGVVLIPEDADKAVIRALGAEGVTIRGMTIEMSVVGIEMLSTWGEISDCSITSTDTGIIIAPYPGYTVAVNSVALHGEDARFGVQNIGGRMTLSRCSIDGFSVGAMITGEAVAVLAMCTVQSNYCGLSVGDTAVVALVECSIVGNYDTGISLSQHPMGGNGSLTLVRNQIESNGTWGISLCGISGEDPAEDFGVLRGFDNTFSGNRLGEVCPTWKPLPEGFVSE